MYSATITKSEHLTLSTPKGSDRLKVGYYPEGNKFFLYVGFDTQDAANTSRDWLISKGHTTAYNYKVDSGTNKPRKSEYSNQAWELKIHRPSTELIEMFIKAEIKRKA